MLRSKMLLYVLSMWWSIAISTTALIGQQPISNEQKKAPTPAQQAYRQWVEHRQALQADGKKIVADVGERDLAGDCKDANTTLDFDNCFGKLVDAANEDLYHFEGIIRELQNGPPQTPEEAAQNKAAAGKPGIAGPVLTSVQFAAEFEQVEQAWKAYRETACRAAFHQFSGGTGGASFGLECLLKLTRDHLHELDMIYGEDLHL